MSARVTLQARVPLATEAASVTFFVDGLEVCVITRRPYVCDWNAGRVIRERTVRMVVTLKDGQKIVKNVRTKGLDYAANTTVQAVQVTVDTMKDERKSLPGTVSWVSSEAEFTPTPIQTREERAELVYAIKIRVANQDGVLKIGMPVDVNFSSTGTSGTPGTSGTAPK